jgi:16S rRNA (uracil1498-N3)-methyltransferase
MHCFYAPQLIALGANSLSDEEWRHIKALRIKPGETICLLDGLGSSQLFEFHLNDKQPSIVSLSDLTFNEKESGVHLYIPMTQQSDRIEWMLEKATEMGIASLNIIVTQYSEKAKYSIDRLQRIASSAMKQSQRSWLPEINTFQSWPELLHALKGKSIFIAHCEQGNKILWGDRRVKDPHVLIGPEGDFHLSEIQDIIDVGGVEISLGEARLRTETAGLLVVSKYYL